MAKTYVKCHMCGKIEEIDRMEIRQEYDSVEDIDEKNILCKSCFYTQQDNLAYEESCGEFRNYEDWMESQGATICDYYEMPYREC
ncbi:MAG: hypothetical protein PHQ35_09510 [Phycisphaerae bacterium]|nr:hypothetical protein [Phycisphaerae bacterium]MDD5239953.1 hypothetical protein [Candidatus Nanoarchaeia archaeon]